MEFAFIGLAFAGGYVASVYTWPKVSAWIVGAETAVRSLEDRIKALKAKL